MSEPPSSEDEADRTAETIIMLKILHTIRNVLTWFVILNNTKLDFNIHDHFKF